MNKLIIASTIIILLVGGFVLFKDTFTKTRNNTNSVQTVTNNKTQEKIVTVKLNKSGFNPSNIEASIGTRVIFLNQSGNLATVNSDDHPTHIKFPILNLGEFGNESSVQVVFDKAGTYNYHNHLNPSQKGTIIIK